MIPIKITKKKFQEYAKQGIYYVQAIWNHELIEIIEKVLNNHDYKEYQNKEHKRILVNNSLNLKLKKHDGKFSHIDLTDNHPLGIKHTIFEYNGYLLVKAQYAINQGSTSNNLCIVIYVKGG